MQACFFIKKVAVLGAGVMGAQIAAHFVNARVETLLFDLEAKEGESNELVNKAIVHLAKIKPSPLGLLQNVSLITPKNYKEDLQDLSSCDLIIEAIAERIDWKEALYKKIAPYIKAHSILVSNTSGLSINALSHVLPTQLLPHFCGLHFFNPPRYMHLVELIPAKETSKDLLDKLETWLTSYLGKGVVRAKDRPNFIANRIGVFSLLSILHHSMAMGMKLDEVDALTGTLLGRPKSATFRTMDVVGLDTLLQVVDTMQKQLKGDPWHALFRLPDWLHDLIKKGCLGQKTALGIYKKQGANIEVFDIELQTWRKAETVISDDVQAIMKIKDFKERLQQLFSSSNKQAQFIANCFRDLFHYCAYHLEEIANNVKDVDLAICWGFGWQHGPFETWQSVGFHSTIDIINQAIETEEAQSQARLPGWLCSIDAFYTEKGAYSPLMNEYQEGSHLPVYQRQSLQLSYLKEKNKTTSLMYQNEGVSLSHLKDEVALLRFKSKANSIDQAVLDGCEKALDLALERCQGLIIYQEDALNFCSGADLRHVLSLMQANKMQSLALMIEEFQNLVMRIKYSPIPVVAACRGRALGGGCELLMHCAAVVAAFESYPGLVEIGVGLLPAGGGCKEMALRAAKAAGHHDLMPFLQAYFQQIATAKIANSAEDARLMAYLKANDTVLMHKDEVLYAALAKIKAMQASNYRPNLKETFKIAGIEGHAKIQAGLVNWLEGGFISQYDYFLANEIAKVICGGDIYQGSLVTEEWILKLEREAFVLLASNHLSQERVTHLLNTGKPLRN